MISDMTTQTRKEEPREASAQSVMTVTKATKAGQSHEELMEVYKQWAKTYNEDVADIGFQGHTLAADNLAKLGLPKDIKILDMPCGTGLCALFLRDNHGFTNIDGLDASPEMIAEAEKLNIYGKIYCAKIGDCHTVPEIADSSYDAVTLAGGLAAGHIKLDAFEELIRVCRPGAYIVAPTREDSRRKVKEYLHMDDYLLELEQRGLWKKVREYLSPNYYLDHEGRTLVYQVTKKE